MSVDVALTNDFKNGMLSTVLLLINGKWHRKSKMILMFSISTPTNIYICREFSQKESLFGDVAQLARALDWQSRGRGFESHLLHSENQRVTEM